MTNIKRIEFECKGIAPLLMDKFFGNSRAKTEDDYKKEAEEKIYVDDKGLPAIPANALKAIIREASSDLGKKMEGKKNRQTIRAGVFITPIMLPIGNKKYDLMRKDIVTRGKGEKVTRVATYRPQFNEWSIKGIIDLIGVEPNFIRQAMELGGTRYGFLGYRPEFGRFIVTKFVEVTK